MTDKWKLALGREEYRKFVIALNPSLARFVALGERDLPVPPSHMVSRDEMLNAFLATRSDLTNYRAEFAKEYVELSQFPVVTALWNALGAVCS